MRLQYPRRLAPPGRTPLLTACVFSILAVVQLGTLRQLHYSKAWFSSVTVAEARSPRDPMSLGGLRWDVDLYASAPSLSPLRQLVRERCPGLGAVATARCLADLFAARFAHDPPRREFFDSTYAPAQDLAAHLAGEPGHCVTRSGLLAATLLAAGFPARVVQLVAAHTAGGHNVAEVWDPVEGWVVVDPTYGMLLDGGRDQVSAAAALSAPVAAHWHVDPSIRPVPHTRRNEGQAIYANGGHLLGGNVVYPDPWLYTRVGSKRAPYPFQGRFVIAGPRSLALGIGQPLLHGGIALCLLSLLGTLLSLALRPVTARTSPFAERAERATFEERSGAMDPTAMARRSRSA